MGLEWSVHGWGWERFTTLNSQVFGRGMQIPALFEAHKGHLVEVYSVSISVARSENGPEVFLSLSQM